MKRRDFTTNQEEEICRLYEEELLNPLKIGEKFGCGRKPVIRVLKKYNISMYLGDRIRLLSKNLKLKTIRFTDEQGKEIVRLYEVELKNSETIGKIFECSSHTIIGVLNKNNVDTNKGRRLSLLRKNKKWVSKEEEKEIIYDYTEKFLGLVDLCKKYHHKGRLIKEVLINNKIKIRSRGELRKILLDIEQVKTLYEKNNSVKEISNMFNCSKSVINNLLKKEGVIFRKTFDRDEKFRENLRKKANERYANGFEPSNKLKLDENKIIRLYDKENISPYQIAMELGCGVGSIYKVLNGKGIKIKPLGFFNKGKCGWNKDKTHLEDSRIAHGKRINTFNNWASREPYDFRFSPEYKEMIRQRDDFTCVKCGMFQDDNLKLYGKRLSIHHINYLKKVTIPQNNCVLCTRCNAEVNFNRPHWQKFFQSMLTERYGYQYKEGEIILNLNGK